MNKEVIICPKCGLVICPKCGSEMVLRNGKHGEFYGCSNYPACKYSLDKKIVEEEEEKEIKEDKMEREAKEEEEKMREAEKKARKEHSEYLQRECAPDSELKDYDEDGAHVDDGQIYLGQKQ